MQNENVITNETSDINLTEDELTEILNDEELVKDVNLTISQHAYQRYAERIKNADDKTDINKLISKYKEKYTIELKKLFISSVKYYTGMFGNANKTPVSVYINQHGWVLLTNTDGTTLITLYKPDLCLDDDDFNKQFIKLTISRLNKLKLEYDESKEIIKNKVSNIDSEILNINEKIKEYEKIIKTYRDKVDLLKELKNTETVAQSEKEIGLRESLENFCTKDKIKIKEMV